MSEVVSERRECIDFISQQPGLGIEARIVLSPSAADAARQAARSVTGSLALSEPVSTNWPGIVEVD